MMLLAPVTNWESPGVTLAGYCYAMRLGMKVRIATPYRVSYLQSYGVTECGIVTSVYPHLGRGYIGAGTDTTQQTNICLGIHRQTFLTFC
jgi:hypothetical protein